MNQAFNRTWRGSGPSTNASKTPLNKVSANARLLNWTASGFVNVDATYARTDGPGHSDHHERHPPARRDKGNDQGHEDIKLFLDANTPENALRVINPAFVEDHRPVAEEPDKPRQMQGQLLSSIRRPQTAMDAGKHEEDKYHDQIVKGPDPQNPTDPERSEINRSQRGFLAQ